MHKSASSAIGFFPQTGIAHEERTHVIPTSVSFNLKKIHLSPNLGILLDR